MSRCGTRIRMFPMRTLRTATEGTLNSPSSSRYDVKAECGHKQTPEADPFKGRSQIGDC